MRKTTTHPAQHDRRRARDLVALVASAAALVAAGTASAHPSAPPRVTIVGDSIMASFDYVPAARRALGSGLDVRSDNAVCRRLVAASCPFQGSTPPTALQVITARGRDLGPTVVINVGYNDWAAVYDVDRVMGALKAVGVRRVVWVTLREAGANASVYARSNARIRAADRRWVSLVVADWNARSRGRAWFRADGLHLTAAGAMSLARLLRPLVLASRAST